MSKGYGVDNRVMHFATAFKLLVSYLEAISGYVQSVPKQVTTICEEHTICPWHPCV